MKKMLLAVGTAGLVLGALPAWAVSSGIHANDSGSTFTPVFGDPTTITAAATSAFTDIATFMIGVLGFWVIFRLVRKIRGS